MENKLQEQIKVLLDKAEDKELIDALININNTANEMISEHDQLLVKHDELKKSYKDAVMHSSFKEAPKNDPVETKAVSFEDMLANFIKK